MKTTVLTILALILPIFALQTSSVDLRTIDSLKQRVTILEGIKENYTKDIDNHKTALQNQYDSFVNETKNKNFSVDLILTFITLIGISAIIATIFITRKYTHDYAEKKAREALNTAFTNKAGDINKLIDEKNEELRLRHTKKILVVFPNYSNNEFLQKSFKKMNFKTENISYEPFNLKINFSENYDVVIFNDENGLTSEKDVGFSEEKSGIEEFLLKFPPDTILFYYGSKQHIGHNNKDPNKYLSFANTPVQFYGNLMNALRFQDKMMK